MLIVRHKSVTMDPQIDMMWRVQLPSREFIAFAMYSILWIWCLITLQRQVSYDTLQKILSFRRTRVFNDHGVSDGTLGVIVVWVITDGRATSDERAVKRTTTSDGRSVYLIIRTPIIIIAVAIDDGVLDVGILESIVFIGRRGSWRQYGSSMGSCLRLRRRCWVCLDGR